MTDNLTFNQAPTVRDSLPSPNRSGVRKEMEALPKVLQPFLTWVVGVPATDETLPQPRPRRYLAKVCGLLLLGISLSCWALVLQGWGYLWLIVGWSLTVSASRQLKWSSFTIAPTLISQAIDYSINTLDGGFPP